MNFLWKIKWMISMRPHIQDVQSVLKLMGNGTKKKNSNQDWSLNLNQLNKSMKIFPNIWFLIRIRSKLEKAFMFNALDPEEMEIVINAMDLVHCKADTEIIN